jgi:hypothetical protein
MSANFGALGHVALTSTAKRFCVGVYPPNHLHKHVEQGGTLQTHDNVLGDIREQLYAKEQYEVLW